MACVDGTINDMQEEVQTEAIMGIPSLHDTVTDATDAIVDDDSGSEDYLKNIAARVFLWLAVLCVREGINEFKISDVKHQFESITYVLLEPAIAILVGEGKVIVPEARSRIIVYSIDVVQALLVAPPLPDSPEGQSVDGQTTKCKKPTAKRVIHVGTGKENPDSTDVPKAKAAKTKDGLQERRPNHGSSSSSSSSSYGGMRPISPFRDDIDSVDSSIHYPPHGAGAGGAGGTFPRAAARFESSPVVSFRLGGGAPKTFLSQEKQEAMMCILCEAFQDCGEGVITRGQLIRLLRDQLPGGLALTQGPGLGQGQGGVPGAVLDDMGDIEEFLRHMSEQNKIMVEGEDIYEI